MTEYSSNLHSKSDSGLIEKFERMLKLRDSYFFDVEEIEAIADYYLEKSNHRKARVAVKHGLSLFPGTNALLLKKAQALTAADEPKKALEILDFLEAAEPTNTDMLLFKAVVYRKLNDHEGTTKCLRRAIKISPDNKEEIFLDLAYEQQIAKDFKGAIESIQACLDINPNYEAGLFELSYCYEMADEVDDGIEYFQKYLNQYPYNFVGWYNLAICYEKIGLYEKSIESADFCIAIREDFISAHILKANVLTAMGLDAAAMQSYEETLAFDDENPLVYTAIGECLERLGHWNLAEQNYQKALAIEPDYIEALMGIGAIREHEGDMTNAIAYYEQAVSHDDFHLDNRHILVEAYIESGQIDKAKANLKEMVKVFPDDAESWVALAEVSESEDINISLEIIDQAIESAPNEYDLMWQKIRYLLKSGKEQEASHLFVKASYENPDGVKYFLTIFPDALHFPNIAGLIEIQGKAQEKDEL
jgi:tetratricopeptide (TPR) repeat protein